MKNLLLLFSIGAFALFATISSQAAYAKAMTPTNTCSGATCKNLDPTAMSCLTSVYFSPYKKPESYNGRVIGSFSSIYSNTCNANWDQAELTPFAVSQGWRVSTMIRTADSKGLIEIALYPTAQDRLNARIDGVSPAEGNSYGGATGWPTVSDMVDGTNQTQSTFYLYDKNGALLMTDDTVVQ